MGEQRRPGGWWPAGGMWLARLHDLDVGTKAQLSDVGGPFIVSASDRVELAGNPVAVVLRWADGEVPAPPQRPQADEQR